MQLAKRTKEFEGTSKVYKVSYHVNMLPKIC